MGFPISHNKTLGPDTELNFIGLTANLIDLTITLPEEKRVKSIRLIDVLLRAYRMNDFMTIKDLERCMGMLSYTCQAIPIGHPWLQSCYALQWVQGDHTSNRKISDRVATDLSMFRSFLKSSKKFLTTVPFLDRLGKRKNLFEILADTSGNKNLGFRCYFPHTGEWFGASWKETNWFMPPMQGLGLEAHKMIFQLELLAITMAFKVFGKKLSGRVVILWLDNISVINAINNMSSDLECTMQLLREITITCMSLQILAKAVHICRVNNSSISQRKPIIPKKGDRANYQLVAHILETLDATEIFGKNTINETRAKAVQLFGMSVRARKSRWN